MIEIGDEITEFVINQHIGIFTDKRHSDKLGFIQLYFKRSDFARQNGDKAGAGFEIIDTGHNPSFAGGSSLKKRSIKAADAVKIGVKRPFDPAGFNGVAVLVDGRGFKGDPLAGSQSRILAGRNCQALDLAGDDRKSFAETGTGDSLHKQIIDLDDDLKVIGDSWIIQRSDSQVREMGIRWSRQFVLEPDNQ